MLRLRIGIVALVFLGLSALAEARGARLELPALDSLRSQATECVDVSLGSLPLRIASWFMDSDDPDEANVKAVIRGLDGLYVRHFEFESDNVYSKKDLDAVRAQLAGGGWSQIALVKNRDKDEDSEVYVDIDHDKILGLTIISTRPRELTIVNAVGSLDMNQVGQLRRHFEDHHGRHVVVEDDDDAFRL
jgi:hypothetical protein